MRIRIFFITAMISFAIQVHAQTDDEFIKRNKLTPPGTAFLKGNVYLDETELTNIAWLEFLHYVALDSTREYYEAMLPDTMVWKRYDTPKIALGNSVDSTLSFTEHYLRYPGYRYFPVVGISFFQATEYCKWRSAAVTKTMNERLAKEKKDFRVSFTYVLPGIEELQYRAKENKKRKLSKKTVQEIKNFSSTFKDGREYHSACVAQPIGISDTGKEILISGVNWVGYIYENLTEGSFYNLLGNVSEMTNEQGTSFGGSWIHTMEEIKVLQTFPYHRPEFWLGFRCACSVSVTKIK
ncbi:SUMF1/EgtB/PvdO family nonheme iron enzyme [Pseudochryseolinea flava]|uniref:Sulfatase-modifying factor enzyme-like domain-containing protein n=1 Tax=Pseudochryseolinea flava TaxID=2059302 RepID=A0A364Y4R8_9BACT|nr:SUMF1/EgtB/PvdO family nonheme iron enzyme [Pseudochryseolinea flava]RAW00827.1 hypothetical protein DQQ10_11305 [Pseudochryseolinea flava]